MANNRSRKLNNNQKLKLIQKHFKLKAENIIKICFTDSVYTVYSWRSKPGTERYRLMPPAKYKLLVLWLIEEKLIENEDQLDVILNEGN